LEVFKKMEKYQFLNAVGSISEILYYAKEGKKDEK
jgi:hypothetical protein